MKINKIELYNFGPYENSLIFDTLTTKDKNIILIGGKNGAGKTTLFTAIKTCLYGYIGMGYKSSNSFYNNAIKRLINNAAKMKKPTNSYVKLSIEIKGQRDIDSYEIYRSWILDDGLKETFKVKRNGIELSENEIADFDKFMLSYLPPELFNLYFFDGEKISDFFLNDGSNKRIKNAFLTICGYDTFDIMKQNFKRVAIQGKGKNDFIDQYIVLKEKKEDLFSKIGILNAKIQEIIKVVDERDSEIKKIDKNFVNSGGITYKELNEKIAFIKSEEKYRELLNSKIKDIANNILPFIMIKNNLNKLKERIEKENQNIMYKSFLSVLNSEIVSKITDNARIDNVEEVVKLLNKEVNSYYLSNNKTILNLSFEQSGILLSEINKYLYHDTNEIAYLKKEIKKSIRKCAKLRKEIEQSDNSLYGTYIKNRNKILEEKNLLLENRINFEKELFELNEEYNKINQEFEKIKLKFENSIKEKSKMDISTKSILMLDELENILYSKQIEKVKQVFNKEINLLMRKTGFIDNLEIDDDFNIKIYKNKTISCDELITLFNTDLNNDIITRIGEMAYSKILELLEKEKYKNIEQYFRDKKLKSIKLPVEINTDTLSNGEKQIYIMALYYSLVSLAGHEIPFIIDTPFARIDTEHRNNISEYFFKKLNGQVFILSTNEEIDKTNYQIIEQNIAKTYILENSDNTKTRVIGNSYFEV